MMTKYKSLGDFGEAFNKIMNETFINYRGIILEKSGTGYLMSGKYYATLYEVDKALGEQFKTWNNQIKNQNS